MKNIMWWKAWRRGGGNGDLWAATLKGFWCLRSPGCHRRPWTYRAADATRHPANRLLRIARWGYRGLKWKTLALGGGSYLPWNDVICPPHWHVRVWSFILGKVFHLMNKVTDSNSRITGTDKRKSNNIKAMNSASHWRPHAKIAHLMITSLFRPQLKIQSAAGRCGDWKENGMKLLYFSLMWRGSPIFSIHLLLLCCFLSHIRTHCAPTS